MKIKVYTPTLPFINFAFGFQFICSETNFPVFLGTPRTLWAALCIRLGAGALTNLLFVLCCERKVPLRPNQEAASSQLGERPASFTKSQELASELRL